MSGRIVVALVVCGALVVVGLFAANRYINRELDKIPRVALNTAPSTGNGINYLIVGSDSRAFVDDASQRSEFGTAEENGPPRSDTLMVLHADGDHSYAVSFPRDLWVNIPGHSPAKINAAFNDGPQKVVDTLASDFGVPINHYLQVDFKTFQTVVDAIGGIPIYVPYPARDANTGFGPTTTAGCFVLDGAQALAYVRSRSGDNDNYLQYNINGKWVQADPVPDIGRIERQQAFIKKLGRLAVQRMLADPMNAPHLVESVIPNLTADRGFDRNAADALVRSFLTLTRGDDNGIAFNILPADGARSPDGQDILKIKEPEADALLAVLRGQSSAAPPTTTAPPSSTTTPARNLRPFDVRVEVMNGSGVQGAAANTAAQLARLGFVNGGVGNDPRGTIVHTEVRFGVGNDARAQLVASHVPGSQLVPDSTLSGSTVVLSIGKGFKGVTTTTAAPPATTAPPASPAATC